MMLGVMLALALVAAAPAVAQIPQEFEQEDVESGDVEPAVDISNTGDNVNLCAAILQSANTGNVQNQQGVSQYLAYADDIEFEGSEIEITPELEQECEQVIEQAAAAAAAPKAAPPPPPAPTPAPAPAPAPTAQAGGGGGAAAATGLKTLPATGGIALLLAVGAGAALLLGGGLLIRRLMR